MPKKCVIEYHNFLSGFGGKVWEQDYMYMTIGYQYTQEYNVSLPGY